MSFSSQIKEKLCKSEYGCMNCAAYELSGALMFGGNIGSDSIKFATENENIAKRITADINTAYGIQVETQVISKVQRIIIDNIYQVENITGGISQSDDIPFSCCRASFVRGAFTKSDEQALRLQKLLKNEGFNSKITYRKGYNVVYIKGSEEIADILGYMGAAQGAFELFSVQIEKEMRNEVNRRVNCENANTNKAAKASSKHLFAIKKIKDAKQWDKLPDVLKEIAILREEYPEDSLKELGEKTNPPIGKSGVNHRLSRLVELAETI